MWLPSVKKAENGVIPIFGPAAQFHYSTCSSVILLNVELSGSGLVNNSANEEQSKLLPVPLTLLHSDINKTFCFPRAWSTCKHCPFLFLFYFDGWLVINHVHQVPGTFLTSFLRSDCCRCVINPFDVPLEWMAFIQFRSKNRIDAIYQLQREAFVSCLSQHFLVCATDVTILCLFCTKDFCFPPRKR